MNFVTFLSTFLIGLFKDIYSVRLLEDSIIPTHAYRGHFAQMRCNYDIDDSSLYSVKWYFNQEEFYRFIPSDSPQITIFQHLSGVSVNKEKSTSREIVLDNLDFHSSGTYRCEVSGQAPMFQTASHEGNLYVVEIPKSGPDIFGGHPRYRIGDQVNVTCLSRDSFPAAHLSWYINNEKSDKNYLIYYPQDTSSNGLVTSKLGLVFKVQRKHFQHDNDLKIKCTASISTIYWKSNEESIQGAGINAHSAPVSESRGRTSAATSHKSETRNMNITEINLSFLLAINAWMLV